VPRWAGDIHGGYASWYLGIERYGLCTAVNAIAADSWTVRVGSRECWDLGVVNLGSRYPQSHVTLLDDCTIKVLHSSLCPPSSSTSSTFLTQTRDMQARSFSNNCPIPLLCLVASVVGLYPSLEPTGLCWTDSSSHSRISALGVSAQWSGNVLRCCSSSVRQRDISPCLFRGNLTGAFALPAPGHLSKLYPRLPISGAHPRAPQNAQVDTTIHEGFCHTVSGHD
jgi:hypothetical protein